MTERTYGVGAFVGARVGALKKWGWKQVRQEARLKSHDILSSSMDKTNLVGLGVGTFVGALKK